MSEDNSNNYVQLKTNCNQCGTVMTSGRTLTCAACQTNNILLKQASAGVGGGGGGGGGNSDTDPPAYALYIAFLILVAVIVIGFLFFPHWGIVSLVKFLWTLVQVLFAFSLVLPVFLWQVLF